MDFLCKLKAKRQVEPLSHESEVKELNDTLKNEIAISNIIKRKLENISTRFACISETSEIILHRNDDTEESVKTHILVTYYKRNSCVSFYDHFQSASVETFLSAYRHVLRSLSRLQNDAGVCFFGFWNKEALIYDVTAEKVLLNGFQSSFLLKDQLCFDTATKNMTIPELKVYVYMLKNKRQTLSASELSLDLSEIESKKFAQSFINKKREKILEEIQSWSRSWDLFCFNQCIMQMQNCPSFLKEMCDQYTTSEPQKRADIQTFIWQVDREIMKYFNEEKRY
jgi:hypothetical protein